MEELEQKRKLNRKDSVDVNDQGHYRDEEVPAGDVEYSNPNLDPKSTIANPKAADIEDWVEVKKDEVSIYSLTQPSWK